jgi:hypothetical protein
MKNSAGNPAFSLTEVVLAMGVAAVAFTSLIGLFPTGLQMSKETYEEAQAALLAQTILNDLRDTLGGSSNGRFPSNVTSYRLVQTNKDISPTNANNYGYVRITSIPLNTPEVLYIAYSNVTVTNSLEGLQQGALMLRAVEGRYLQTTNLANAPSFYQSGGPGFAAVARIIVRPAFYLGGGHQTRVAEISVETPGSARFTNRVQYLFSGAFN